MYRVVLTCWDPGEKPYADDLSGVKLSLFDNEHEARVAIEGCVKQELATLNWLESDEPREKEPVEDSDGNIVGYDYPFRADDCADHTNIIRFWDGDDYKPVTAYDIYELTCDNADLDKCSSFRYRGFEISANEAWNSFRVGQFGETVFACSSLQEALREVDEFMCTLEHKTPSLQAKLMKAALSVEAERSSLQQMDKGQGTMDNYGISK